MLIALRQEEGEDICVWHGLQGLGDQGCGRRGVLGVVEKLWGNSIRRIPVKTKETKTKTDKER